MNSLCLDVIQETKTKEMSVLFVHVECILLLNIIFPDVICISVNTLVILSYLGFINHNYFSKVL